METQVIQPVNEDQVLLNQRLAMHSPSPPKRGCHETPDDLAALKRLEGWDTGQHAKVADLHWIVMGDVVGSSNYEQRNLQTEFANLIRLCNEQNSDFILSPYTITLGDEFQGVATSLFGATRAIDLLNYSTIVLGLEIDVRFVVYQGAIETPINGRVAHGMLGAGLTAARELLENKSRRQHRVRFRMVNEVKARNLELLWLVADGITRRWKKVDYGLISMMLGNENDYEVASACGKTPAQIWKRRKTLQIEELEATRELTFSLAASETHAAARANP